MNDREQLDGSQVDFKTIVYAPISEKDWEAARKLATNPEYKFREATVLQAKYMAHSAQIELTPDQITLYCALREQMFPPTIKKRSKPENTEEVPAQRLSDQEILATVLRETGKEDQLKAFTNFFSNIFGAEPRPHWKEGLPN